MLSFGHKCEVIENRAERHYLWKNLKETGDQKKTNKRSDTLNHHIANLERAVKLDADSGSRQSEKMGSSFKTLEDRKNNQPENTRGHNKINERFFQYFDSYISEIEYATKMTMSDEQKTLIKEYASAHTFHFLSLEERNIHRAQYSRIKCELIEDWLKHNGKGPKDWPSTKRNEMYNCKLISKRSTRYQPHHVILSGYGGPSEWWNIFPAPPVIHQDVIHGEVSVSRKIFTKTDTLEMV